MAAPRRGIEVPKGVLIALVGALALALLLAVFLLGRQSASAPTPVVIAPGAGPPGPAGPAGASAPVDVGLPAATVPPAAAYAPAPAPGGDAIAPAPAVAPAGSVSPEERADVARYFQDTESIQSRAKYWSDPQSLAKTLIDQMGQGKTDGFDELIVTQRKARDELASVAVPAACAEHHRRSVQALSGGLAMLENLKGSINSGNMDALASFPSAGRDLEREAREIDELAKQLRERYGT